MTEPLPHAGQDPAWVDIYGLKSQSATEEVGIAVGRLK